MTDFSLIRRQDLCPKRGPFFRSVLVLATLPQRLDLWSAALIVVLLLKGGTGKRFSNVTVVPSI